jgi:hypothetical protein
MLPLLGLVGPSSSSSSPSPVLLASRTRGQPVDPRCRHCWGGPCSSLVRLAGLLAVEYSGGGVVFLASIGLASIHLSSTRPALHYSPLAGEGERRPIRPALAAPLASLACPPRWRQRRSTSSPSVSPATPGAPTSRVRQTPLPASALDLALRAPLAGSDPQSPGACRSSSAFLITARAGARDPAP